ncbi:hypothetical protein JHW46_04995 [Vibrio splendidus]|nr:hypothetical protein [Vibrio splendidus]
MTSSKPTHYNQFTISYIEAIKTHLNVEVDDHGEACFFPDSIGQENIVALKDEIQGFWIEAEMAIEVVRTKHDSNIQSGLFGLIDDLDQALKVGFLIADRVVLIDYLFERILLRKNFNTIDLLQLGGLATSLVSLLPLAKIGRVVIIPTPFIWNPSVKVIAKEIAEKTILTPALMSMINMLSITKSHQLHPYTVAESDQEYRNIIDNQIDHADAIGKDAGNYAYDGILGALLSEKLIQHEFKVIAETPLLQFYRAVTKNNDFRRDYISQVTSGGSLNSTQNISNIRSRVSAEVLKANQTDLTKLAKPFVLGTGISGGALTFAATVVASAPLAITGAALSFSSALGSIFSPKKGSIDPVISLFSSFYKN